MGYAFTLLQKGKIVEEYGRRKGTNQSPSQVSLSKRVKAFYKLEKKPGQAMISRIPANKLKWIFDTSFQGIYKKLLVRSDRLHILEEQLYE